MPNGSPATSANLFPSADEAIEVHFANRFGALFDV